MDNLILFGFLVFVLGMVGKLIYDVQQIKRNKPKQEDEFVGSDDLKDYFQTLAGIKPHDSNKGTNDLVDVLKRAEEIKMAGFPEQDKSYTVKTDKLTTISLNSYNDYDPLNNIPFSRLSLEAKNKMAEIAREDIKRQVEENALNMPEPVSYYEVEKPKRKSAKPKATKAAPKKKATKKVKTNE